MAFHLSSACIGPIKKTARNVGEILQPLYILPPIQALFSEMGNRINTGTLIFFCGKMGAGKSTKAREIAEERNAVLLCEDEWLESLYPGRISSLKDYIQYSNRLKPQIRKLSQSILRTGTDVVMDFPANTISQRKWFRQTFMELDAPHCLIFIDVTNQVCLEQIEKRRVSQPERAATDTIEMFEQVTKYFIAPTPAEGFNITRISDDT